MYLIDPYMLVTARRPCHQSNIKGGTPVAAMNFAVLLFSELFNEILGKHRGQLHPTEQVRQYAVVSMLRHHH